MNKIKAIIFDYGGVITKDLDDILIQDIADKFQMTYHEALEIINELVKPYQRGEISNEKFWELFSEKSKKELPDGHETLWIDKYDSIVVDQRVIELVKKLKESGYIVALLSNTISPHAKFNEKHGFFELFNPLVLSIDVGSRKPEEKIYQIMLEKINLSPDECVFIDEEDEEKKYAEIALKIGMHSLKFKSYEKLISDLSKLNVNI